MNLVKHQRTDFERIYLYVKVPFESKYQLLVNRIEKVIIKLKKKSKDIY